MLTPALTFAVLAAARLAQAQYASTTTFAFAGNALPTGLANYYSRVNDTKTVGAPYDHEFEPSMSYVEGGFLNLLVPGGQQNDQVIWSAEVQTTFTVSAARVDTWAILTETHGVCNGIFSYDGDTSISGGIHESDIEWLSDPKSLAFTRPGIARALYYTNQNTKAVGSPGTSGPGVPPSDATSKVHKYSIEWRNGLTSFFVDDVPQYTFDTNVPTTTKAVWVWNNWANGDPNWSVGLPATDAVFKIQKIVMAYNPGSK